MNTETRSMNPPITPGESLLGEYLQPMRISKNAMARAIGVAPRANAIFGALAKQQN